ncbi:ABC-2 family transporter [Anaerobacterium chartisolvens]|uniref:ABC-2 family transporter n=1 Tax=Anaerobacterium chartisolvens TaxID=1297424 RepID=A0A369AZA6_9FIRM|nr:ABC-2 transporter permease [Anaerobacterium chartisolvens]RCX13516.1 ABC-2 family transporter [Anaerobacterium chartisolvens]
MLRIFFIDVFRQKKLIITYFLLTILSTLLVGALGGIGISILFSYKVLHASCMSDEYNNSFIFYLTLPMKRYFYVIEKHILSAFLVLCGIGLTLCIDSIILKSAAIDRLISYNINSVKVIVSIMILLSVFMQSAFIIPFFKDGIITTLKYTRAFGISIFVGFLLLGQLLKYIGMSRVESVLEKTSGNILIISISLYMLISFVSIAISSKLFDKRHV